MAKASPKPVRGVFERPEGSGIWWVQYFADGQRHREKVGRRSDAIALYQKRKTDIRTGAKLPEKLRAKRKVLCDEIAEAALTYSRAHKRTHRQDASYWKTMQPVFGKLAVDEVTPAIINDYFASRKDLAPATINRLRSFLSMTFQEALRNGKVDRNPARLVRLRKENNARIRFLTFPEEEQIRQIILQRTPTHEPAFTFAIETGMRLSEQHKMTWSQVDFARRQVFLEHTKNGTSRSVVLSEKALEALRAVETRRTSRTDCVWLSRFGEPLISPVAWFKLVMGDARSVNPDLSDVTWHVFRHTFVSRLVMAGVDLRTVQELAGHKTITMTTRYAHLSPNHKLSAIAMLSTFRHNETKGLILGAA